MRTEKEREQRRRERKRRAQRRSATFIATEQRKSRRQRLRKFGMEEEDYQKLLMTQNGCCVICKTPPTIKRLAIDHDHRSDVIRGLLCGSCNIGLGHFKDSSELLEAAAAYLRQFGR